MLLLWRVTINRSRWTMAWPRDPEQWPNRKWTLRRPGSGRIEMIRQCVWDLHAVRILWWVRTNNGCRPSVTIHGKYQCEIKKKQNNSVQISRVQQNECNSEVHNVYQSCTPTIMWPAKIEAAILTFLWNKTKHQFISTQQDHLTCV